jgi:hypothetical protein
MSTQRETDGELKPALARLDDAFVDLVGPQTRYIENQGVCHASSLYQQLRDSIFGEQGSGNGVARSMPPMWVDCADLLNEIDTTVACWQPQYDRPPPTIGRLHVLANRSWRPQDCRAVNQIASALEAWARQIIALLDPPHIKTMSAPCPACNAETVLRRDSAEELVRQPALQITVHGCQCQSCKTEWTPDRYLFLCKLLGWELPAGVLE